MLKTDVRLIYGFPGIQNLNCKCFKLKKRENGDFI